MPNHTPQELLQEAKDAINERDTRYLPVWEKVWKVTMPQRDPQEVADNKDFLSDSYDSTAISSANRLANMIMSGLVPPWTRWFKLIPGPLIKNPEDRKKLGEMLEDLANTLFAEMARSNFTREVQPTIKDAIVGTCCMKVEPTDDNKGIRFRHVPIDQIAGSENRNTGTIDRIYHQLRLRGVDVIAKYRDKLSKEMIKRFQEMGMQDAANKGIGLRPARGNEVEILSIVVPDEDKPGKFRNVVMLVGSQDNAPDGVLVLEDKTLDRNPYKVMRWEKVAGGQFYGTGPAVTVGPDARTLNKITEYTLYQLGMDAIGAWLVSDDSAISYDNLQLRPGVKIPVLSNATSNPPISRLESGSPHDAVRQGVGDLRQNIRDVMLADRFSPTIGTKMTATEITQRALLIAQELGSTYVNFVDELFIPLLKDALDILISQNPEAKKIAEEVNLKLDRRTIDVLFLASIAQAQRLTEANNIIEFTNILGLLSQLDESAILTIDAVKAAVAVAEMFSISPELIRTPKQVEERSAQMAQAAQDIAQQQAEIEAQAAQPPPGEVQ